MVELLQLAYEFLFANNLYGHEIMLAPIDPVTGMALASAGSSLLGGLLSSFGNKRQQVDTPPELGNQIDELSDPNVFMDQINRMFNDDATAFQVDSQLASQGINSPTIAREQRQAQMRRQGEQKTQALDQTQGTRLSMLNNLLGQKSRINQQNAQLAQQHNQNRMNIINETVSGIGGSITQGLGAKIQQQNFDRMMDQANTPTGWQGGQGFGSSTGSGSMFDMMMSGNNDFMNFG